MENDDDRITSIHYAAEMGRVPALRRLIASGEDVNSTNNPIYSRPVDSPLFQAAWNGHHEAVEVLLENGADPDYQNLSGNSALIKAAMDGDMRLTTALLSAGANPNHQDRSGWTPLRIAKHSGHDVVVAALLNAGAEATP